MAPNQASCRRSNTAFPAPILLPVHSSYGSTWETQELVARSLCIHHPTNTDHPGLQQLHKSVVATLHRILIPATFELDAALSMSPHAAREPGFLGTNISQCIHGLCAGSTYHVTICMLCVLNWGRPLSHVAQTLCGFLVIVLFSQRMIVPSGCSRLSNWPPSSPSPKPAHSRPLL